MPEIIDRNKPEHAGLPLDLDGHVLLDTIQHPDNSSPSYVTAPVERVRQLMAKSDAEIEALGLGFVKDKIRAAVFPPETP